MSNPQYADVSIREQLLKTADLVEAASVIYRYPNVQQGKGAFYAVNKQEGVLNVCILGACHLYNQHIDADNPKAQDTFVEVRTPQILRDANIIPVTIRLSDFDRTHGFEPQAIGYLHHVLSDLNDEGYKPDEIVAELRRMAIQLREERDVVNVRIA